MQELFTILSKLLEVENKTEEKKPEIKVQDAGINPFSLRKNGFGHIEGQCLILLKEDVLIERKCTFAPLTDEVVIVRTKNDEILSEQDYKKAEQILHDGIHEHCKELLNDVLNSDDSIDLENDDDIEEDDEYYEENDLFNNFEITPSFENEEIEDTTREILLEKIYIHEKDKKIDINLSVLTQHDYYIGMLSLSEPYDKRQSLAKQIDKILKELISTDEMFENSKEEEIDIITTYCEVISIKDSTTTSLEKYIEEEKKNKSSSVNKTIITTAPVVETKWNEIIRNLREDNNLTQKEVASLLGVSQRVYSNYECGQTELSIGSIITLSKFYKVSTDYLLGLTNKRTSKTK